MKYVTNAESKKTADTCILNECAHNKAETGYNVQGAWVGGTVYVPMLTTKRLWAVSDSFEFVC